MRFCILVFTNLSLKFFPSVRMKTSSNNVSSNWNFVLKKSCFHIMKYCLYSLLFLNYGGYWMYQDILLCKELIKNTCIDMADIYILIIALQIKFICPWNVIHFVLSIKTALFQGGWLSKLSHKEQFKNLCYRQAHLTLSNLVISKLLYSVILLFFPLMITLEWVI